MNPNASVFWMEAGAIGTGGSRNQLEIPDELAQFFGPQARESEIVLIQLAPGILHVRPFVYCGDDYDCYTERWRLCLPTASMGGPEYADRVVRFDRLQVGAAMMFQLTVSDRNSPQYAAWEAQSVPPNGGMGQTHGNRQYGWWGSDMARSATCNTPDFFVVSE